MDCDEYGWDDHGFDQLDETVQLENLSGQKRYKVSNVKLVDPIDPWAADGAEEWLGDLVGLRPGGIYTKTDLARTLQSLRSSHYLETVDLGARPNDDGTVDVHIPFREKVYPPKKTFKCLTINNNNNMGRRSIGCARECLVPREVQQRIEGALRHDHHSGGGLRSSLLRRIVSHVHKWYWDHGYYAAHVVSHGPLEDSDHQIIFQVDEGDIAGLDIRFQDRAGNACTGNTNVDLIRRALPRELAVGRACSAVALEKAYRNICSLDLFSRVSVLPKFPNLPSGGAVSADIVLQEHPHKWRARVASSVNIQPAGSPPTSFASLLAGTTISLERRNIKGLNRSLQGSLAIPNTSPLALSNIFLPEDFNLEYTHPYMDGINDPRNRTFKATCFSTKQQSPVFKCGPRANDDKSVDRKGIKATITENYTKKSKFTYGVVMEDIRTRDEDGSIASSGHRVDHMATFQANLTRDNTKTVNGSVVGAVDVIQVDQGVGIGTRPAFFNRLQMSATRFIPLSGTAAAAPPVLVLHGAFGNCLGDVPNHEAFGIGGPHSVRGYNQGGIGASRSKLEVSAEIRVPVKSANLYGFIEHGNDLRGSVGNRTRGHGSSAGVGIQFGPLRAEYVIDDNSGKGSVLFHFGDKN